MPQQPNISNCPPGLEYLTAVDQLLVHQKVELLEGNLLMLICLYLTSNVLAFKQLSSDLKRQTSILLKIHWVRKCTMLPRYLIVALGNAAAPTAHLK